MIMCGPIESSAGSLRCVGIVPACFFPLPLVTLTVPTLLYVWSHVRKQDSWVHVQHEHTRKGTRPQYSSVNRQLLHAQIGCFPQPMSPAAAVLWDPHQTVFETTPSELQIKR